MKHAQRAQWRRSNMFSKCCAKRSANDIFWLNIIIRKLGEHRLMQRKSKAGNLRYWFSKMRNKKYYNLSCLFVLLVYARILMVLGMTSNTNSSYLAMQSCNIFFIFAFYESLSLRMVRFDKCHKNKCKYLWRSFPQRNFKLLPALRSRSDVERFASILIEIKLFPEYFNGEKNIKRCLLAGLGMGGEPRSWIVTVDSKLLFEISQPRRRH